MDNVFFDENGDEIKIKPKYYTMSQLAKELGVAYSTIRYWCNEFKDFLDIDLNKRKKEFNGRDVELLKIIQGLKNKEMTIKQIYQHLEDNIENFDSRIYIDNDDINDLAINNLLDSRIDVKLNKLKSEIVEDIGNAVSDKLTELIKIQSIYLDEKINHIEEEIAVAIDSKVNNIGDKISSEIKDEMIKLKEENLSREEKQEKLLNDIINSNKSAIDEIKQWEDKRKEFYEEKKKGFWDRLLGK